MNLFVLVRILFQYLERVDPSLLRLAKEVLKDCERKHNTKDSKYGTLADAINERVRDAVGETHWAQAKKIQKQLVINQQRKKMVSMKTKSQAAKPSLSRRSSSDRPVILPSQQQNSPRDKALEAARTMSALSQSVQSEEGNTTPRSNNSGISRPQACLDESMRESEEVPANQNHSSYPGNGHSSSH